MVGKYIYKGPAVGCSFYSKINMNLPLKFLFFSVKFEQRFRHVNVSVVVSKLAFIQLDKNLVFDSNVAFEKRQFFEWFSNAVDLSTDIFPLGIRQKHGFFEFYGARCEIDKLTRRMFPNAMKFCFDHKVRPLPYCPANYPLSTVESNMFFNDVEAIYQGGTIKWLVGDGNWFGFADATAEGKNIRF